MNNKIIKNKAFLEMYIVFYFDHFKGKRDLFSKKVEKSLGWLNFMT